MKKFIAKNSINFVFLISAFICLFAVLGIENSHFENTRWLHHGDAALHQTGWYFFLNDVWRFPLGDNPNYGDEIGHTIVYSDAIPIFAFFFKSIKTFIPSNFQYFSLWYLICFFFQLFFSFKIIKKLTGSVKYSLIGSIFFLIAPIFVYRLQWHAALAGHWILLFALYLGLTKNIIKSKFSWLFLIALASLVNVYLTAMVLIVYSVLRIFSFSFNKKSFIDLIKDFLIILVPLIFCLYISGYLETRAADTLGLGFGVHKMNLLSIFDAHANGISWSWFLPNIEISTGEEIEGFNYMGLGQILMLLFAVTLVLNKNYKEKLVLIRKSKIIKIFFLISAIFLFWSLTNKISFGLHTLIEIPLNKYIYGLLSAIKSTGRVFWIVNYFLLILSLIIIYKCFNKKKSLLIITLFLIIQIADTSSGIRKRLNIITPIDLKATVKDSFWNDILNKYKIVKATYPVNYSLYFHRLSYLIEKKNIKKTNVVWLARTKRKAAAEARYDLYNNFRNKNVPGDVVYIVQDMNHLRHLKYLFKNENVGFFYRDKIWTMVKNEKNLMNENDNKLFKKVRPKLLEINSIQDLYFENPDNYYGFGWSHNFRRLGIWSEGPLSTLFFRTKKDYGDLKVEIFYKPYITEKNNIFKFDIFTNDLLNKSVNIELKDNDSDNKKIEMIIKKTNINNNEVKIDFNFKNPISPYEIFENPDSRKLGILVKNIKITPI